WYRDSRTSLGAGQRHSDRALHSPLGLLVAGCATAAAENGPVDHFEETVRQHRDTAAGERVDGQMESDASRTPAVAESGNAAGASDHGAGVRACPVDRERSPVSTPANRRVLIVDDTQAVHADFAKILAPRPTS